jgi:hypothetical protein
MNAKRKAFLKSGVEAYLGKTVVVLETYGDPKVEGTYAVRANVVGSPEPKDFLIQDFDRMVDTRDIEQALEECEFSSWPPTSK